MQSDSAQSVRVVQLGWAVFWCVYGLGVNHNFQLTAAGIAISALAVHLYAKHPHAHKRIVWSGIALSLSALVLTAYRSTYVAGTQRPSMSVNCGSPLDYLTHGLSDRALLIKADNIGDINDPREYVRGCRSALRQPLPIDAIAGGLAILGIAGLTSATRTPNP